MRLDSCVLPKEACCIRALDPMDFVLSLFAHHETIPKEIKEDWARALNQVANDLADAVKSEEDPYRTKSAGIAARWYLDHPSSFYETSMGEKSANSSEFGCGWPLFFKGASTRPSATGYATATMSFKKTECPSSTRKSAESSKASDLSCIILGYVRLSAVLCASTCRREILRPRGQRRLRGLHATGGAIS